MKDLAGIDLLIYLIDMQDSGIDTSRAAVRCWRTCLCIYRIMLNTCAGNGFGFSIYVFLFHLRFAFAHTSTSRRVEGKSNTIFGGILFDFSESGFGSLPFCITVIILIVNWSYIQLMIDVI